MKRLRKITAAILAIMMASSMCMTSFSAAETVTEDVYVIAGTEDLTGYVWDAVLEVADANVMTESDGVYSITFADVPAMDGHNFKVVKNGTEWIGDATGNNYAFNTTDVGDVTITYNPTTGEVTFTGDYVEEVTGLDIEAMYAVGNGDGTWLNDVAWDPAAEENKMTEIAENVWQITYKGVEEFDNYEVKFAANGTWSDSWGASDLDGDGVGDAYVSGKATAAAYNGLNIVVEVPYEYADVTLTLDLNDFDFATKTGGTYKIDVVDPTAPVDPPVEDATYVIAGTEDLTGYIWADVLEVEGANVMTKGADGVYSLVLEDVAIADGHMFKVVKNGTEWIGDATGNNFTFNTTSVCDVTITYNPATGEVTFTGESVEVVTSLEIDGMYAVGNGDGTWLNGEAWVPNAESNKMTEIAENVWQISYTDVEEFDNYEVKFAANGTWTDSWGATDLDDDGVGDAYVLGEASAATYNGLNIVVDVPYELATVTLTIDLNDFDYATKTGGTFKVDIEDTTPVSEYSTYYLRGNITLALKANEQFPVLVEGTVDLPANTYKFLVQDAETGNAYGRVDKVTDSCGNKLFGNGWGYCTFVATGGTYKFTFNTRTKYLKIECDNSTAADDSTYRARGSFNLSLAQGKGDVVFGKIALPAGDYRFVVTDDATGISYGRARYYTDYIGRELCGNNWGYINFTLSRDGMIEISYNKKTNNVTVVGVTGAASDYTVVASNLAIKLDTTDNAKLVSKTVKLEAGTYNFAVTGDNGATYYGRTNAYTDSFDAKMVGNGWGWIAFTATGGTYTFTYNTAAKTVAVAKVA